MAAKQGDITAFISATGTVEPEELVDVGTQVAGVVMSFGRDRKGEVVDYGSVVEEGMVLARIDDSLYAAAVETAQAQVGQAQANQQSAQANVLQAQAKLLQARLDWERAQRLGPSEALAQSLYDQYQAAFAVAQANLATAEAGVRQSAAAVAQAQAALRTAKINLGYCTVKSPVKGVIIDRRVNIGQTVVASLSAPSLFLIAKDLKRVEVWVSVNEADIGSIKPGQAVTFTVDAFAERQFNGKVGKLRLNATMSQNVVTYTVEVETDNPDGVLLPYLTANARFHVGERQGVLLVPNAALRWSPRPAQIDPQFRGRGRPPGEAPRREQEGAKAERGTVWVSQGETVRPLRVRTGLSDGVWTEAEGKELAEGLDLIVGEPHREQAAPVPGEAVTPFTPSLGRGGRGAPGGSGAPGGPR
jgi:HlyD family secretion protein